MLNAGGPIFEEMNTMKDTPMPAKQLALLYLIYLLRASVFMDRSGGIVRSKFVYCLYELDRVDQYSWGASVLSFLYKALRETSRADAKQICGCLTLFEVS